LILTPQRALHIVTDLGDAALLLPAALLMLGYFLYLRSLRGALAWASAVGLCIALTIVAKLGFMACGSWLEILDIRSPSGHTSLSTIFYCGSAVAIAAGRPEPIGRLLLAASILLVLVIAASRVLLNAHSAGEVVLGLAIGGVSVAWFAHAAAARNLPAMAMAPIAACFIALALALHHMHVTLEGPLEHLASLLRKGTCG
jgi:membrane-associated phospholipid phosphatase